MKKRLFASLLTMTLMLSSLAPVSAYADESAVGVQESTAQVSYGDALEGAVDETAADTQDASAASKSTDAAAQDETKGQDAGEGAAASESKDSATEDGTFGNEEITIDDAASGSEEITIDDAASQEDLTKAFVARLYTTLLLRESDETGLNEWTALLKSGKQTGADIISGFIFSDEFKKNNYSDEKFVELMYNAMFDRSSDPTGKAGWLACLDEGFSRNYVCAGFVGSDEFKKLCDSFGINPGTITLTDILDQHPDVTKFVNYLYEYILGRDADPSGRRGWVTALCNHTNTAAKVVEGFVFSDEFTGKNLSDTDYVTVLYNAILGRTPDASGLNAWVSVLDNGLSRRHVLKGFLESTEFASLCAKYGIEKGALEITESRDKNEALTKYLNDAYKAWYNRSATASELNYWTEDLMGNKHTLTDFVNTLVGSVSSGMSNENYIKTAYQTILQRSASSTEVSNALSTVRSSKQKFLNQLTGSSEFSKIVSKLGLGLRKEGWNNTSYGSYYVKNGSLLSGWQRMNGSRYYFDPSNGNMRATGWTYISGYKYYFDSQGRLQQNVEGIIGKQSSYKLVVSTSSNTVTVYAKDGSNGYIIPVKSIICSTGKASTPTIKGTFTLRNRYRWASMMGGVWGQYVTQISGDYLFHSAWYYSQNNRTLSVSEYNKLGNNASHGCIRLTVADAKWIYDNCIGSTVTITTSAFQPFDKPSRPTPVTLRGDYGYDPTDPNL